MERACGCKGCRTCLICESSFGGLSYKNLNRDNKKTFVYCPYCNIAWPGWDINDYKKHPTHEGDALEFPGIYIDLDFLSSDGESRLIEGIDSTHWELSQSGRRKQNFGPKCNFKKNKLKLGDFIGFPSFTKFVQEKFQFVPVLDDFQTIEQCSLEYDPKRGASIDPHVDDCWIWGERIVTVNLLNDSVLTMTYNKKPDKYNLHLVSEYPKVLNSDGSLNDTSESYQVTPINTETSYPVVRIPMPRRSLLVMYNSARYDWEHQILREDIVARRICIAYREFTPPYLKGGHKYYEGKPISEQALNFCDINKS